MHEYLLEVDKWFFGTYCFQVVAESKADALKKGRAHIRDSVDIGYMHMNTLRVIRKLKPSFGGDA